MFGKIKSTFLQFKKPTCNAKEVIKLSLWIAGVYVSIGLLPFINSSLVMLPSGLFLVLLLNYIEHQAQLVFVFFHHCYNDN